MEPALPPKFQAAADAIAKSQVPLADEHKLEFYALYKQATTGPCNVPRPGFFDFVGKAKWDAWNALGTLSRTEAAARYIALAAKLLPMSTGVEGQLAEMSVTKPKPQKGMGAVFSRPEEVEYESTADNFDEVRKMLAAGVKVDAVDEEGRSALMWACDRGHLAMAEHLLKSGANVNAKDKEGQTPLHYATLTGETKLVSLLLQYNADVTATDKDGMRPADLAEDPDIKALLGK